MKMETKMEKLIKEKEKVAKNIVVRLEALPITSIPTTLSSTTSTRDVEYQLKNVVQIISLQTKDIKKLQYQVKIIQDHQNKTSIFHATELQRAQNQIEGWKKAIAKSSISQTLGHVKEIIQNNIIEEIDEIWQCIQIIFKHKELMEKAEQTIATINAQLLEMPATANNIIKFLNTKNIYELDDLGVDDIKETILEVKKVLTNKNLVIHLTEKCHTLEVAVNMFFNRIDALNKKYLPSVFVINDKLMTKEDYMKKLQDIAKDTPKSSNIKGSMTGGVFYEAMNNINFIQHERKHILTINPLLLNILRQMRSTVK